MAKVIVKRFVKKVVAKATPPAPVKRGPGRPPGTKNTPKVATVQNRTVPKKVVATAPVRQVAAPKVDLKAEVVKTTYRLEDQLVAIDAKTFSPYGVRKSAALTLLDALRDCLRVSHGFPIEGIEWPAPDDGEDEAPTDEVEEEAPEEEAPEEAETEEAEEVEEEAPAEEEAAEEFEEFAEEGEEEEAAEPEAEFEEEEAPAPAPRRPVRR